MPILTTHGQSCRVTYPSMIPETSSAKTRPIAIEKSARPSCARACTRVREPGAIHDQKIMSPAAAATNTLYSSSWPCGAM